MDKAEFISKISNLSRKEINDLIQRKGKKTKQRKLFTRVKSS